MNQTQKIKQLPAYVDLGLAWARDSTHQPDYDRFPSISTLEQTDDSHQRLAVRLRRDAPEFIMTCLC